MLQKFTKTYAEHGLPLECDVYTGDEFPRGNPVVLYFHPGGLVDWGRDCVAPWLVQSCYKRKWPLISPSYRLLPQTGADGLLSDAKAAYEFARKWEDESRRRRVIVVGASGGFFPAALIAHHCSPAPLALLSIGGINTFRHPFFNSSTLLTPEPIPDEAMRPFLSGSPEIGVSPPYAPSAFRLEKLHGDGSRNDDYKTPNPPKPEPEPGAETKSASRGMLYDYFTYNNAWLPMLGSVDPGYGWAAADPARAASWPRTLVLHGDADFDVPLDVSVDMRACLGGDRVEIFVAGGREHLYELTEFIEGPASGDGMTEVRELLARLDEIVAQA